MPKKKSGDKEKNVEKKRESSGSWNKLSPKKRFWVKEIAAILLMYVVTLALFWPMVAENTRASASGDGANATVWNIAGNEMSEELGTTALWNPYVFMGYPTFGSLAYLGDISFNPLHLVVELAKYLFGPFRMNDHIIYYFLSGLFVYLFARGVGLPVAGALLAGMAMLLNPYNVSLMEAGHGSKHWTIAVIPLVFLMTWRVLKKTRLLDMGLLAISIGVLLLSLHVQIAYYALVTAGVYALVWAISVGIKDVKRGLTGLGMFAGGSALGLGLSFYLYWPIYTFAKYSIRGTSPLKAEAGPTGLDWDYATQWSLHPLETLQFFIPGMFGLGGSHPLDRGLSPETVLNYNLYWGYMPFTQSSLYMGIIVLLLAIFGAIFVFKKSNIVRWMTITAVFSLVLSFGKFFPIFYKPMYHLMPFFSKFRVPSMVISLFAICVSVLAGYGLVELINRIGKSREENGKSLNLVVIITGAVALLGIVFALFAGAAPDVNSGMFLKEGELGAYGNQTAGMLVELRWTLFNKSMLITSVYLLLFAAITFVVLRLKEFRKRYLVIIAIAAIFLSSIDLFVLDKRFMHPVQNRSFDRAFATTPVVNFLKNLQEQENEPFRIYPLGDKYQSNYWMYHGIQSIGGYSPAKLRVYQDYLDYALNQGRGMPNLVVAAMMNARYLVYKGQLSAQFEKVYDGGSNGESVYRNPFELPRTWFVNRVSYIEDPVALMDSVASQKFNPVDVAFVNETPDFTIDGSALENHAVVPLGDYTAHAFDIKVKAEHDGFMVVSEIYYPQGWEASLDGEKVKIWRVNHGLRGVVVPAGEHTIRMEFHPPENRAGMTLSWISFILILGVIGLAVGLDRKKLFPAKNG